MPDTTGAGYAWLAALEQARERLLNTRTLYPFTRGLRNESSDEDEKDERDARKAKRKLRLAEALKSGVLTGYLDEDDEERMSRIVSEAAAKAVNAALEQDAKKVDPAKRPEIETGSSQGDGPTDSRPELPDYLRSTTIQRTEGDHTVTKTVKLPLAPGGLRGHSVEADRVLDEHVAKALVKSINLNKFPRNFDSGDFCVSRYCLAREMFPYEGSRAFAKYAPKESAYYQALDDYGKEYKALGEMTSGQDGGFLAPEIWTNVFFDMLYPAQVMSRLPITRMQMGGRVQHIPKLTSQVTIAYAAENAALAASQPQFAQLSFTARKQYA